MTTEPAQQETAPDVVTALVVGAPEGLVEPSPDPADPDRRYMGLAGLGTMALCVGAYGAMETMIAPIIPFVQADLGATGPQIAWMFTGLLLVGAISLPLLGRLAEVYDKRTVVVGSLVLSSGGAVITALAPNIEILIAGQLLQGVGIGAQPLAFAIVRETYDPKRVGAATAFLSGTGSLFAAIGLLATGPILNHLDYTFVYWIPVAIIVVGIIGIVLTIPELPPISRGSVDWTGAGILGGGLALLLVGLTLSSDHPWLSFSVIGLMVIGAIGVAAFVSWERRVKSPLLDLPLMRERIVGLTILIMAFMGLAQFTLFTIMPSLAVLPTSTGYGMGGDGDTASLIVFTFVATASVAQFCLQPIRRLLGDRGVLILQGLCLVISAVSILLVRQIDWMPWVTMAVGGFGLGVGALQTVNIILERVAPARVPSVVSSLWVVRSIGGTFGSQIAAAILAANIAVGATFASFSGYAASAILIAIGGVAIVVLASLMGRASKPAAA
jgi:MFS family permease